MKPDFALLLSFDGIALLRRASAYGEPGDGWYLLGTVSPNVPDLESALADLRARAIELAPGGDPEVKLVLPTEQVKFLDIDTPDSDISVAEAVEAALDGATPYTIDELVYDFHKDGAQVHIAAVARETLDEAESFAIGNGFLPLGYVSDTSPDAGFTREPFFGPTQHALTTLTPGVTVQGDDAPIAILDGTPPAEKSADDAPVADAAPEEGPTKAGPDVTEPDVPPAPEAKPAAAPEAKPAPEERPTPKTAAPAKSDPKPEDEAGAEPDPVAEPEKAPTEPDAAPKVDASPKPVSGPDKTPAAPKPAEPEAPAKPAAATAAPADKPEPTRTPDEPASKPVETTTKPAETKAKPAPAVPVEKAPVEKPAETSSGADDKTADDKASATPEPVKAAPGDKAPAATKPATADKPAPIKPAATPAARNTRTIPAQVPLEASAKPPKPADAKTVPPAPKPLPADPAPVETPGFSSIRAQRDIPLPRPAKSLNAVPDPAAPAPRLSVTATDEPRDVAAELAVKARDSLTNRPKVEPLPKAPGTNEIPKAPDPAASEDAGGGKSIGFASRRTSKKAPTAKAKGLASTIRKPKFGKGKGAAAALASGAVMDESDRMTVFGARGQQKVGGKPRFLGLILTAVLLLLLLAVAAVASIFLDDGLAGLFRKSETPIATAAAPEIIESEPIDPADPEAAPPPVIEPVPETALALPDTETDIDPEDPSAINVAALSEGVPAMSRDLVEDQIDGLSVPFEAEQLTPEQAEARYAATGIWQRAPVPPEEPTQAEVGDVYVASIDPSVSVGDAVAIPTAREATTDLAPPSQTNPYPPDSGLTFDQDGLIEPTPEGVRHPAGFLLVMGPPPVKPPLRPGSEVPQPAALPEASQPDTAADPAANDSADSAETAEPEASADPVVVDPTLDGLRPRPRPEDLAEQNERANLGGISLDELRQKRPKPRPEQAEDKTEAEKDIEASALAVAASVSPKRRPSNIDALVQRAERAAAAAPAASTASSAAAVAPRTVTPRIPSSTTVSAAATEKNAINLRRVNLIGVYGKPSSRRALIRLANGRYKKVKVGDRIDGGRVSAIGEGQLSYVKSGRSVVLRMPRG